MKGKLNNVTAANAGWRLQFRFAVHVLRPGVAEFVRPQSRIMSAIIHLLLAVTSVFLSGCDFVTGKVSLSDPRLAPMLQAIAVVDRAALGFTPIPTNAEVHLESRPRSGYDAMLHIYAGTSRTNSRTIAFRKTATGYKWIHEQEIHSGPKTYTMSGHAAHEAIVITYETESITGRTPGKLEVHYTGPDSRMANRKDLTLDEVRPILTEWSQKR